MDTSGSQVLQLALGGQQPQIKSPPNQFGALSQLFGFGAPSSVSPVSQYPSQFFWGGQGGPQQMQFGGNANPFGGYGNFGQFGGGYSGINPFQSMFSPFNQFGPQQGLQQFIQQQIRQPTMQAGGPGGLINPSWSSTGTSSWQPVGAKGGWASSTRRVAF